MDTIFGGEKIRDEIFQLLKTQKILFTHLIHQETIPYKIAHEMGINMNDMMKSLMIRGKKSEKNVLVCLRGRSHYV